MENNEIAVSEKSPTSRKKMLTLICLFWGYFGIHRFMTKKYISGVIQLFTLGGYFVWWLVDLLALLTGSFKDSDGVPFKEKIAKYNEEHPESVNEAEALAEQREKTKKVAGMAGKFIWSQMIAPHMHSSLFGGSGDGGLHWYVCSRCGLCVKEGRKPEVHGCSESQVAGHDWIDLAPVGNINYHCSKCDLTIQTSRMPERRGCTDKGVQGHAWKKL